MHGLVQIIPQKVRNSLQQLINSLNYCVMVRDIEVFSQRNMHTVYDKNVKECNALGIFS